MLVEQHRVVVHGYIVTIDVIGERAPDGNYLTADVHRDVVQACTGATFNARDVLQQDTLDVLAYQALELTRESEPWSR